MMTLPGDVQMFVAEACSGMRQLTGFLALDDGRGLSRVPARWYRVAVVASAIPIAMTANVARVILTGYIMYFVDPQYASGTYHTVEGLLMMGFGLSLLRAGCWVLDQICALTRPAGPTARPVGLLSRSSDTTSATLHANDGTGSAERGFAMSPMRRVLLCGLILTCGFAAQASLET